MESRARPQPRGRAGPVPLLGLRPPTGSRKRSPDPGLLKSLVLSPKWHHGLWTRRWVSSNSRQGVRGSGTAAGGEEKGLEPLVISQGHHSAVESNSRGFGRGFSLWAKGCSELQVLVLAVGPSLGGCGGYGHSGKLTQGRRNVQNLTHTHAAWLAELPPWRRAGRRAVFLTALVPSPLSSLLERCAGLLPRGCHMEEAQTRWQEVTLPRRCCTSPGKQRCC